MATPDAPWLVRIEERGREGTVRYEEGAHELRCHFEFGGNDVIAMITVGTMTEWASRAPWAVGRRDEILGRIAGEVIRQRAPGARADLDERLGAIHLRAGRTPAPPGERRLDQPSSRRSRERRSLMRLTLVGVALLAVLAFATVRTMLTVRTTGAPWGASVREGDRIVTLISRVEPYVPSLDRSGGDDRSTLALLVQSARDPGQRRMVTLASGLEPTALGRARLTGITGGRVSFLAPGAGSYDLDAEAIAWQTNGARPAVATTLAELATGDDALRLMLAAGVFTAPDRWLGLLTDDEAARDFRPGSHPGATDQPDRTRGVRRAWVAAIDRTDGRPRIVRITPLDGDGMRDAALVREGRTRDVLQLEGGGYLIVYETGVYPRLLVAVARLLPDGTVAWSRDTEIGTLREVLPDAAYPALIGERPHVADSVAEPILVVIDAGGGATSTRSLWVR